MKSRTNIILAVLMLLLVGMVQADPSTYPGSVTIDTITTAPGNQVSVAVRLKNNNVGVSYLFFPLKYNYTGLKFDSVSFTGTILPSNFSGDYSYDVSTGIIRVVYVPDFTFPLPTMTTTSGLLFKLHFTVLGSANLGNALIDSVFQDSVIAGGLTKETKIVFADNTGSMAGMYYPAFTPGAIIVSSPTGVDDGGNTSLPVAFDLGQNYPNPFNPSTRIAYSLPKASQVKLEIYNVLGQLTMTLVDGEKPAGNHEVVFDASMCPSGIYFYRLTYEGGSFTRKMVFLK
jgi:hypothetical protein